MSKNCFPNGNALCTALNIYPLASSIASQKGRYTREFCFPCFFLYLEISGCFWNFRTDTHTNAQLHIQNIFVKKWGNVDQGHRRKDSDDDKDRTTTTTIFAAQ